MDLGDDVPRGVEGVDRERVHRTAGEAREGVREHRLDDRREARAAAIHAVAGDADVVGRGEPAHRDARVGHVRSDREQRRSRCARVGTAAVDAESEALPAERFPFASTASTAIP